MSSFSSSVRSILPMAGAHSHRQSQLHHQQPSSRLLLLLTVLPLTLATLAFVLQWRGGVTDPVTRWSPDHDQFPGMATAVPSLRHHSDCDMYYNEHFRGVGADAAVDLLPQGHRSFKFSPFRRREGRVA
ncbi:hypothetical protein GYH30_052959 [Glycine max]|nr:hypothetical protein GYH30_052959 [Glycine max]